MYNAVNQENLINPPKALPHPYKSQSLSFSVQVGEDPVETKCKNDLS
jgi:hypothetical protein